MTQSCLVLVCLWTVMFSSGNGQGVGDVIVDGQLEGENFGSFICEQRCPDQDGEGVREIRDDTMFGGNHFGSCVCQQSCSGQGTITEDRMEVLLRGMASSIEVKMGAMADKFESLQQTVNRLTQDVRSGCPMDFVFDLRANICFKLYTDLKSRADASTSCQNLGGANARLVVLDTPERFRLVREHLSAHHEPRNRFVWIGGRQEVNEGQWLWETGQEVTGHWGSRQPDNYGGNADCLAIYYSSSQSAWLLFDYPCSYARPYLCEY